ncbi:MAG: DNA methyltransferase [Nitrospira sp.]|nr:DNA methyltransferase [Nitrospira sp.]
MKTRKALHLTPEQCVTFLTAVRTGERVRGLTHGFYRYPARFSPEFPAAAITCFTKPGDLVLDPYMGGGTTIVEALARGRRAIGNDLNELAVFVARVKTKSLNAADVDALSSWARRTPEMLNYHRPVPDNVIPTDDHAIRNLGLYRSRYLKKAIALALATLSELPTSQCRDFARCAILHVGQLALDGRRTHTTLKEFRSKLRTRTDEMLNESLAFTQIMEKNSSEPTECHLYEGTAENLPLKPIFSLNGEKADLVITSPPYPGVHVLYHRWQVDGRKETPAPYWIAGCRDGQAAAYYNFGDRQQIGLRRYFETAEMTFRAVRSVMKNGAHLVQLVAFNDPETQLRRYLDALKAASLEEVSLSLATGRSVAKRIWREVPNRKWYATSKGLIRSAREVLLIHRAA